MYLRLYLIGLALIPLAVMAQFTEDFSCELQQGKDNFDNVELHPQWMWNHVPDSARWSLSERPGYLRLYASPTVGKGGFFNAANTLNQHYMRGDLTENTAAMDIDNMADGQIAGLAHFNGGKTYAFIGIQKISDGYKFINEENDSIIACASFGELPSTVYLKTAGVFDGETRFFYSLDGEQFRPLGKTYEMDPGNFRGDMIGIFTYNDNGTQGYVDIDFFDYVLSERKTVLFIGDSITDGAWGNSGGSSKPSEQRTHWDQNHIQGHGYMNFCASHYMSLYPGHELRFYNRGISGNTLANLEERWEKDAIAINPDVVSILIGTNDVDQHLKDVNLDKSFDVEKWGKRYQRLIDLTREKNPDVKFILCTPFVAYTGKLRKSNNFVERDSLVRQLTAQIEQLASDNDAILVPFNQLFDDLLCKEPNVRSCYWIWDGIHPTMAGHRRMADLWIELVSPIIK